MTKIFLIGGGELREMQEINERIVRAAGVVGRKPNALFFPQASGESKPYVNSFAKEFGSRLKCKTACALWKCGEMDRDRIAAKVEAADIIYIGGGRFDRLNTEFENMGVEELLRRAAETGKVIAGNSAGAMILSERSVSDYTINEDGSGDYSIVYGYGLVKGTFVPHFDEAARREYAQRENIACGVALNSGECFETEV